MRRMSGRTPNFFAAGFTLLIIFMIFKLWTLTSKKDDLLLQVEKLQAELKLSGLKQNQLTKKADLLQTTLKESNNVVLGLKIKFQNVDEALQSAKAAILKKEDKIASVMSELYSVQDDEQDLKEKLELKQKKLEAEMKESHHMEQQKNEAEESLQRKNMEISHLKVTIDKLKRSGQSKKGEQLIHENENAEDNGINVQPRNKETFRNMASLGPAPRSAVRVMDPGRKGLRFPPGQAMLPRQPSNVKRQTPRYFVGGNPDDKRKVVTLGNAPQKDVRVQDVGLNGFKIHQNAEILPREPSDVERKTPRFGVGIRPVKHLKPSVQIQVPESISNMDTQQKQEVDGGGEHKANILNNVIQNPPSADQVPALNDNIYKGVLEKPVDNVQPVQKPVNNLRNQYHAQPVLQQPKILRMSQPLFDGNLDAADDDIGDAGDDAEEERDDNNNNNKNEDFIPDYNPDDRPDANDKNNRQGALKEPNGIGARKLPSNDNIDYPAGDDEGNGLDDVAGKGNKLLEVENAPKIQDLRRRP